MLVKEKVPLEEGHVQDILGSQFKDDFKQIIYSLFRRFTEVVRQPEAWTAGPR